MAAQRSSLTADLLSLSGPTYKAATQSPFLRAAGQGQVDKKTLGTWLANDRLYLHAYTRALGRTLATVDLPQVVLTKPAPETDFADWLSASLAALRREDRLFVDTARRYELDVELETVATTEGEAGGREVRRVPGTAKLTGLVMFERLFGSLHPAASVDRSRPVPWLEAAVVFWGTEKVYCDAWTWAKSHQQGRDDESTDADGGALRVEFVPNWANDDFRDFVEQLARIIDRAVDEAVEALGEPARVSLAERATKVWKELLDAEAAFWPALP